MAGKTVAAAKRPEIDDAFEDEDDKPAVGLVVPKKAMVCYVPRHKDDPSETKMHGYHFRANVPKLVNSSECLRSAMTNPWFTVDGKAIEVKKPGAPRTPESYKLHAVGWIGAATSHADMERQWNAEDDMRTEIGVGSDDLDYILPRYNAKYIRLKKAADDDAREGAH